MESLNIKILLMVSLYGNFVTITDNGDIFMHDNQKQALNRKVAVAYCAGLIDGEGSLCFRKAETPATLAQTNRKSPVYSAVIRIGMTQKEALEFLNETFPGGSLLCEGVRKDRPTYQVMYRWELRKRLLIIPALKELMPFFKAKKKQSIVLLDALENWKNPINKKLGVDPEELQRRELAWATMRKLNAVGAAATTNSQSIREDEVIV